MRRSSPFYSVLSALSFARFYHRVIQIVSTTTKYDLRTQGDANPGPDNWIVSPEDVLGKVYFNTSLLLPVAKFAKTAQGFIWILAVPSMVVGGSAMGEISE